MADVSSLIAAYVTQMQHAHHQGTRGIATPEERDHWWSEAVAALDALVAEARADERRKTKAGIAEALDLLPIDLTATRASLLHRAVETAESWQPSEGAGS